MCRRSPPPIPVLEAKHRLHDDGARQHNFRTHTIPAPDPEPSLFGIADPTPLSHYIDDIFGGSPGYDAQYEFLERHFLPWLSWARLRLSFKKFRLFEDMILEQSRDTCKALRLSPFYTLETTSQGTRYG